MSSTQGTAYRKAHFRLLQTCWVGAMCLLMVGAGLLLTLYVGLEADPDGTFWCMCRAAVCGLLAFGAVTVVAIIVAVIRFWLRWCAPTARQ